MPTEAHVRKVITLAKKRILIKLNSSGNFAIISYKIQKKKYRGICVRKKEKKEEKMLLNENELMMKCSPIQHSTQLSCPHEQDLPDCCGILEVSST
jgi:hypothetical protein